MIRRLIERLGPFYMSALITGLAVVCSLLLYSLIGRLLGSLHVRGYVTSFLIPLIVAPPISLLFLRFFTRLVRAERALRENESRYRQVFEQVRDAIYITSRDGRIIDINDAGSRIFGYTREEFRELTVQAQYRDPSDRVRAVDRIERDGFIKDREVVLLHKDGAERVCLDTAVLWRDEAGEILGYISVLRDITVQQKTEEELQALRLMLASIIDSMPSVLIGLNTAGRVTHWNRQAEADTGLNASETVGKRLEDLALEPADLPDMVQRAMEERTPQVRRNEAREVQGETRYFDLTVYPLTGEDAPGAVVRLDDATARLRMEEVIIQTEKMLSVGGLAAGMAHEINNPLVGIIQGAQNILRRLDASREENREMARECGTNLANVWQYMERRQISRFLNGIIASGRRAARIVANMLEFSRRTESQMAPVRLEELLDKAVELSASDYDLKKRYDFQHIEVRREYSPGLPPVCCDATAVEQVALNLLKNAAHALTEKKAFPGEGPHIAIRTGRNDNLAFFEVADNGPGMDEATRKRVFEPFFTTKPAGIGTGLGLSVSYFIISETHRGAMSVDSSPGEGATFRVGLPIADADCED